jgi:sigma-B regulation protein RsbU (phosphoserine phosphatase)
MANNHINVLLVEDNKDFARLVQVYLDRFEKDRFSVVWTQNYADAMAEMANNPAIDIVLMDYFLPGKNGLQITQEMTGQKIRLPIVFLTVNKDFDLALEVMKLGVEDYLVKEEISSPVLPKTILAVIEKRRLKERLIDVEVSRQRLAAIHQMLASVVQDLEAPLEEMDRISAELTRDMTSGQSGNYARMIAENVKRIIEKLERLKTLKEAKTVNYIKDIKMIDIS